LLRSVTNDVRQRRLDTLARIVSLSYSPKLPK
jgi:hypothetical protein